MTAGIMVFPGAQPSRNRNGGAVYAELRFYTNCTTIPKTVYSDEALTTPLPFPVVSDDAGRFVAIWATTDDPYTVNWATADGQSITLDDLTASLAADAMILDETDAALEYIEGLVAGYAGTVLYDFSTTTTDADPGAGFLRFNNDTLSSVTSIYADNVDASGVSATTWLDSFDAANSSANRGTLTIRSLLDSSKFAVFYVSGTVTDGTGYRKIPVTWIDGTTRPANLSSVSVNFVASGPQGTTGDAGDNGWTPIFAVVDDGERRVEQVTGWTGGTGTPPASGVYVGPTGFVATAAEGSNIRGPNGPGTGDMLSSANLSDVDSVSASRTNLGLGTAAVLDVGTSVGNVVQVLAGQKLPVLDGSNLTNIPEVRAIFYGDGSSGSSTISGSATLSSDAYYDNITLIAGADVLVHGGRLFVKGTLDLSNAPAGALKSNGSPGGNASSSAGGVAPAASTAVTVGVGATARTGATGQSGAGSAGAAGNAGGNGGASGTSGVAGTGANGAGGAGALGASPTATPMRLASTILTTSPISGAFAGGGSSGGSGPGGGGDSGAGQGGGGGASGAGGEVLAIYARTIVRGASTAASAIQAKGGAGGNGAAVGGDGGAGSGGGGGGGGWVYIVCDTLSGVAATNAVDVSGGAGGNGGNSGSGGGGSGGGSGQGGRFTLIQNATGSVVDSFSGAGNTAFVAATGATGGTGRAATSARYDL